MNERASSPEEQPEELRDELLTKPDSVTDDAPATVEDEVADPDHTDKLTLFSDDRTSPLEPISFVRKTADLNKEPMPEIHVAKRCEVGAIRERNEDACLVFMSDTGGSFPLMPFGLYIVADGMGGHQNGHIASKTASRLVAHKIINKIYIPLLREDENPIQAPIQEVMTEAVQAAHQAIYDPDPDQDGGTTLTAALILGRRLYIAHVGDTRVYMKTADKFEMLTTDHSLVQRLQDVGQLTAEEATFYQYRHILLRALGQGEEIEVDIYMRSLPKSGTLLLCTDGLCGMVSDNEMKEILNQDIPLEQTADNLLEAAMTAGGYDNITAILVRFQM
jgi:protein phosphatase